MGKLIALINLTLDGKYTGPAGDKENVADWAESGIRESTHDGAGAELRLIQEADGLLMGRTTAQLLSEYWPFQEGTWAKIMNSTQKYVVARKGEAKNITWGKYDTLTVLDNDMAEDVAKLKSNLKGNLVLSASGNLMQGMLNANLIDEFHILVHPVILGSGNIYLENITARHDLRLVDTKVYKQSGCVMLHYVVE